MNNRDQKLVDLCFSFVLTAHENQEWFNTATREDLISWVVHNLKTCGFDTQPMGVSHGVLKDNG